MRTRRRRVLPAAVLAASTTVLAVGCGGSSDSGARTNDTAVDNNDITLDGVRFEVRRDPG